MSTKNPLENTQNIINEKIAKTCNIIFFFEFWLILGDFIGSDGEVMRISAWFMMRHQVFI